MIPSHCGFNSRILKCIFPPHFDPLNKLQNQRELACRWGPVKNDANYNWKIEDNINSSWLTGLKLIKKKRRYYSLRLPGILQVLILPSNQEVPGKDHTKCPINRVLVEELELFKKSGISVDVRYHHTRCTSAASEPFQPCRTVLPRGARQTRITLTNTNEQQMTQSDIERRGLSRWGWAHGPTFPPSFPAEPGKPCSPGTPGDPGWPRSPVGPGSPDLPWRTRTILDQPRRWKHYTLLRIS